jgi:2-polyprenyl-6-hydroxyphenyl methylase/3-demethylubiquinone-9 3-methyltransferase
MTETPARAPVESRFDFGRNWQRFLAVLTEERIAAATASLRDMLGTEVAGARFLDVGSGSGLSSLAASRLGAVRIHSFDFDEQSVACTRSVRDRYGPANVEWTVERGSALDAEYLATLGEWDIVYSWGVLHHTGAMWDAIHRVSRLVRADGLFFFSIYNDQGLISDGWKMVKRLCNSGRVGRAAVLTAFLPYFVARGVAADQLRLRDPRERYQTYYNTRGMSMLHDWLDWLGGYPFEVATPDAIFDFCRDRGLRLERLRTRGGSLGCNEFVFRRAARPSFLTSGSDHTAL